MIYFLSCYILLVTCCDLHTWEWATYPEPAFSFRVLVRLYIHFV